MTGKMGPAAGAYTESTKAAAEANQDFVMGYVSQTPNAWPGGPGSPGKPLCLDFRHLQCCMSMVRSAVPMPTGLSASLCSLMAGQRPCRLYNTWQAAFAAVLALHSQLSFAEVNGCRLNL